jgi:hypothetical protein
MVIFTVVDQTQQAPPSGKNGDAAKYKILRGRHRRARGKVVGVTLQKDTEVSNRSF